MLSELKTYLQIYYMVASMVPDLEADQNDADQMMLRTGLVYQWLETKQHGNHSCCHHWSSVFRNEE